MRRDARAPACAGFGFHYMLRDLCYVFLSWGEFLGDGMTDKDVASRFVAHLMRMAADHGKSSVGKFARLRDNLKWIKLMVRPPARRPSRARSRVPSRPFCVYAIGGEVAHEADDR
jgi:hypothetical protein